MRHSQHENFNRGKIKHIESIEDGGCVMPSIRRDFSTNDEIQNFCRSNAKYFIEEEDK